jgi:hypothetical protein
VQATKKKRYECNSISAWWEESDLKEWKAADDNGPSQCLAKMCEMAGDAFVNLGLKWACSRN